MQFEIGAARAWPVGSWALSTHPPKRIVATRNISNTTFATPGRDRPPSERVLGYESTCAAGWTRSKSSFREMLSVSAVMSTTLPSRICIKKA